jgi:regulator of ribonuclease activity A
VSKATADLYDEHSDTVRTCSLQFRDFGGRRRFSGPVRTVKCLRDNQLFRSLLDEPGNGAVAVVDGGGSLDSALLGDVIAGKGARNGWSGCVIVGAVRDSMELARIDFGVKALGVNPAKSSKAGLGSVDQAVEMGGVKIRPGDWIYCDEDGILVSPVELA